jgi:hypothetical protein
MATTSIDPISQFKSKTGRYPGNNKQWWVARADVDDPDTGAKAGDFMPELLDKLFYGNNHAPQGHYILLAMYKDRSSASGISGLPIETVRERPNTIAFFSGRVWYGCNSTVYFSQVLTDRFRAGLCYQEADPTSENISDLIATDGGVIPIPEVSKITRLVPHGGGLLVLATNGIWNVTGTAAGFSALDITVNKVSPVGCSNPMSVVETEAGVFWWSDIGIMGMAEKSGMYGPIAGAFDRTNISESTIQTFYNEIDEDAKGEVKGVFDAKNNRIMWLYASNDIQGGPGRGKYDSVLLYDLALNAFYPWKFSSLAANTPYVKGIYPAERINLVHDFLDVESDGVAVQANTVPVVADVTLTSAYPSNIEYFAMQGNEGRFCQAKNTNFVDWERADNIGVPYDSYVETGYELYDDAMRPKQITYLFTYLRQTESSWNEDDGIPFTNDPSSCYMTIKWDWANTAKSNKWTTPVQVYRPGRFLAMDGADYDTGYPIVVTKSKIRGNGKAIQFRYGTDERGRNFDLHGWSVALTGKTVP